VSKSEFVKPGSKLVKATARLMVDLMFSMKNDISLFGSGGAIDFSILAASFFYESKKY